MHAKVRPLVDRRRRAGTAVLAVLAALLLLAGCGRGDPPLQRPVANAGTVEVREDRSVDLTLTGEDPIGFAPEFTVVEGPSHGTLQGTAPDLTYVPDEHFLGSDSFTFTVTAGGRTSDEATVVIEVLSTPYYVITRGSSTESSDLYRVDERQRMELVGDTGHALTTVTVDPTDGKIYATTRADDTGAACDACLVVLDPATAEPTVVGALDHDGDPATEDGPVVALTFTSDGTLYGFSRQGHVAVRIDETTGATTVLGDSGLFVYGCEMWSDEDDTLWFINGDGNVYTVNKDDGSVTLIHAGSDIAEASGFPYQLDLTVRGDRDPATGKYWGVSPGLGAVVATAIARLAIDADTALLIDVPDLPVVAVMHDLAFVR